MKPEDVEFIVVHCSKTTRKQGDGLAVVDRKCRLRGALSCGYHFVISRNGTVQNGRALDAAGNHAIGFNTRSIGICLVGMPGTATEEQMEALDTLLAVLREQYPAARAVTHEQIQPTTGRGCPGFKLTMKGTNG